MPVAFYSGESQALARARCDDARSSGESQALARARCDDARSSSGRDGAAHPPDSLAFRRADRQGSTPRATPCTALPSLPTAAGAARAASATIFARARRARQLLKRTGRPEQRHWHSSADRHTDQRQRQLPQHDRDAHDQEPDNERRRPA